MATKSLYLRYRPRRFSEIKGQEHVTEALRKSVAEGREGQAYLFSGPRGTGKTTTARVLAKVLNCQNPVDGEPCCECESCLSVERGTSYDVHELDAASNNGVEAMRDLIEKASLGTPGRHKVYILDEVHMLSKAAEAALLKTLEEPPDHVVFVLATTDPQKMSDTIRSRTQHHQFRLLPSDTLLDHARWVAGDAGLGVSDDALEEALARGGGSARDTLTALETIASAGGEAAGHVDLDAVLDAMVDRDPAIALATVAAAVGEGRDARTITEALVAALRNGFLTLMAPDLVQLPTHRLDAVAERARRVGAPTLVRGIEVLGDALTDMRHAPDARVVLDVAVVKLTSHQAAGDLGALTSRLDRIEERLAGSGPGVPTSSGGPGAAEPTAAAAAAAPIATDASAPDRPASSSTPEPDRDPSTGRAKLGSLAAGAPDPVPTAAPEPVAAADESPPGGRPGHAAGGASAAHDETRPIDPTASAERPEAGPAPSAANAATPSPPPDADTASASHGSVDRDAWEAVRPTLKGMVKAVFSPAEFVTAGSGSVTLALPNETHRDKCEQHRPAVEEALTAHLGRSVAVELTVAGQHPAPAPAGPVGGSGGAAGGASMSDRVEATPPPPSRPPSAPVVPAVDRSGHSVRSAEARSAVAQAGHSRVPGAATVGAAAAAVAPVTVPASDEVSPTQVDASAPPVPDADEPHDGPDLHVVASDGREIAERARRTGDDGRVDDPDDLGTAGETPLVELPADDEIDLDDLVDAPPEAVSTPLDRLAEAFPGSELVDDDELY